MTISTPPVGARVRHTMVSPVRSGVLVPCGVCGLNQMTVARGVVRAHPRGGPHCLGSGLPPRVGGVVTVGRARLE